MKSSGLVFVSGANGFIGRNLCLQLQKGGKTVRAFLRKNWWALGMKP